MAKRRAVKKRTAAKRAIKKKVANKAKANSSGCGLFELLGCSVIFFMVMTFGNISENPRPFAIAFIFSIIAFVASCVISEKVRKKHLDDIGYKIQHGIHIDMTGEDYERYVAKRLLTLGYKQIRTTKASGDHGADIIAVDPNGISCAIQCKYYSSSVGNKAVQEALSGSAYYGCQRAIVITNNDFTRQAIEDANKIGVELISRF